ncbi:MAG: hypothetical protein HDT02_06885 [Bacteroidales bacterium]|nr:hypothetical protein [Bacteroidales bacterium]
MTTLTLGNQSFGTLIQGGIVKLIRQRDTLLNERVAIILISRATEKESIDNEEKE